MYWLHLIAYFFGGAFLSNAVPHFVSGVTGRPFQSPFAKPPGKACRRRRSMSSGASPTLLSPICCSVASALLTSAMR
jgi:hypothetical protein